MHLLKDDGGNINVNENDYQLDIVIICIQLDIAQKKSRGACEECLGILVCANYLDRALDDELQFIHVVQACS